MARNLTNYYAKGSIMKTLYLSASLLFGQNCFASSNELNLEQFYIACGQPENLNTGVTLVCRDEQYLINPVEPEPKVKGDERKLKISFQLNSQYYRYESKATTESSYSCPRSEKVIARRVNTMDLSCTEIIVEFKSEEQIYNWCKSIIEDAPYTYGEPTEQSNCENERR